MPSPCHFFKNGGCSKGAECTFSHDRDDSRANFRDAAPSTNGHTLASEPCRFFVRGNCSKGKDCPFSHRKSPNSGPKGPNGLGSPFHVHERMSNASFCSDDVHNHSGSHHSDKKGRPFTGASATSPPCKYWAEGSCRFGNTCHFRHDSHHHHGPGPAPCRFGEACVDKKCWFAHPPDRKCKNPRTVSLQVSALAEAAKGKKGEKPAPIEEDPAVAHAEHDKIEHRLKELHATMKPPEVIDHAPISALISAANRYRRLVRATAFDTHGAKLRDDAFSIQLDEDGRCTELEVHVCEVASLVVAQTPELAKEIFHAAARLQEPSYPPEGKPVKVLPHDILLAGSLTKDEARPALTMRQALEDDGETVTLIGDPTFERTMVELETTGFFEDFDAPHAANEEAVMRIRRVASAVTGTTIPQLGEELYEAQLTVFKTPDHTCPPLERKAKYIDAAPRNLMSPGQFCVSAFTHLFARAAVHELADDMVFQPLGFVRRLPESLQGVAKDEIAAESRGAFSVNNVVDAMSETGWAAEMALVNRDLLADTTLSVECPFSAPLREYASLYNTCRLGASIDLRALDDCGCGEYTDAVSVCLPIPEQKQLAGLTKGMQRCRLRDKYIARMVTAAGPPTLINAEAKAEGAGAQPARIACIATRVPGDRKTELLCVRPSLGRRVVGTTFQAVVDKQAVWNPIQAFVCTKSGKVMGTAAGCLPSEFTKPLQ